MFRILSLELVNDLFVIYLWWSETSIGTTKLDLSRDDDFAYFVNIFPGLYYNFKSEEMPPVGNESDIKALINDAIKKNHVTIFAKTTCPYCKKVRKQFRQMSL